jgi:endoglucanase
MYAIVNTHHEDWVSLMPNDDHDAVSRELEALWTQIATRFRDYDDHLVFEVLNEPRTTDSTEWTGGTPEARQILNGYNLAAVNAIRATGGNNRERFLMVPTHAANPSNETIADLVIPNDDPHIIVSLHTYYPYELSLGDGTQWGSNQDRDDMAAELDRIHDLLPARGRAVVIGEWGTENRNNTQVRADHAATYARMVRERGMCPIWWDNGVLMGSDAFGLLDRQASPPRWGFQDIVTGLVDGATAGSP